MASRAKRKKKDKQKAINMAPLDYMKDGIELESIYDHPQCEKIDILIEQRKAIAEIEKIRCRPCLCYVANTTSSGSQRSPIIADDILPLQEMVSAVDEKVKSVDIFLVTNGGVTALVQRIVDILRSQFDEVHFILPSNCMSAGTILVLSGDSIWMDERACLGPIDPQSPNKEGRFVPAQSIFAFLKEVEKEGNKALEKGENIPWHYVRLLDTMDRSQIGTALTWTQYAEEMACRFLKQYKFRTWTKRGSTGKAVSIKHKEERALAIAKQLASHEIWKDHAHSISRDEARSTLRLKIEGVESVDGLERAVRRLMALVMFAFDKTRSAKLFLSEQYCLIFKGPQ